MATRYAVANGNWSATATWDGGTLPGAADDVYANNRTVTIDQDVTVVSLRNAALASPAITAGGTFNAPTSGTRTVNANVISAANGSVVTIPAGTVNFTLNGNITGGTNANSTFTMGTYTFVNASLSSYPTVTIVGNITAGSVTNHNAVRHGGGTLYVTGTVTGGSGGSGTSCYGIEVFNSNNVPSYTEIKTGSSLVGGTNTSGNTGALAVTYSPAGASITPSAVIINCNLTGGASGSGGIGNVAYHTTSTSIITTITGNVTGTLTNRAINYQSGADLTINGNIYAASTGSGGLSTEATVVHNSGGLIIVNGDLIGTTSSGAVNSNCVYLQTSGCRYTQTGNLIGGTSSNNNYCLWSGNAGQTITINGNITGGYGGNNSWGLRNNNSSPITINGNVTGGIGANGLGISNESTATITVNGTITAGIGPFANGYNTNSATAVLICDKLVANDGGPGAVGINSNAFAFNSGVATAIVRFKKLEFGARGNTPISGNASYQLIDGTTNTAKFYTSAAGTKTLVDGNAAGLMPAVTDVRSGVSYNAGNLTGTCAVPAANSVAAGVAVDNTTGTAVLTQANVWGYSLSSASSVAGSVGEKLKKTAIPADIIALG